MVIVYQVAGEHLNIIEVAHRKWLSGECEKIFGKYFIPSQIEIFLMIIVFFFLIKQVFFPNHPPPRTNYRFIFHIKLLGESIFKFLEGDCSLLEILLREKMLVYEGQINFFEKKLVPQLELDIF